MSGSVHRLIWLAATGAALLIACDRSPAPAPAPVTARIDAATAPADSTLADEQARFDRERRPELVIAAMNLTDGSVVADVGAGTGQLTVHVARAVGATGRVVATDIDASVLELLRQRATVAKVADRVTTRVVAADEPGLEAASYDAILLSEVDHYFADRERWLAAASTSLRPGGRIVITNRIHHRPGSVAAASKAGLRLVSESTPIPSHFIAVFAPAPR